MSGHFHVHGPHDHEVEHAAAAESGGHDAHAAHGEGAGLAQKVALMTAILAFCGAISSWQGSVALNDAMLLKNESILLKNQSVLKKTEASNQWNYYQAKSSKQNLAELGAVLAAGEAADRYQKEVDRYKKEKEEIKVQAEKLEAAAKEAEAKSEASMNVHHRWAQATTLVQIAIALAAITILTRNRGLMYGAYGAASGAGVLGAMALMHI